MKSDISRGGGKDKKRESKTPQPKKKERENEMKEGRRDIGGRFGKMKRPPTPLCGFADVIERQRVGERLNGMIGLSASVGWDIPSSLGSSYD